MMVFTFTLADHSTFDGTLEELIKEGHSEKEVVKQEPLYDDELENLTPAHMRELIYHA